MSSSTALEVPPVRLPGQRELPSEDGEPMETDRHDGQASYLKDALREATAARGDVFVGANMFVYFSPLQLKNQHFRGPDFFAVVGLEPERALQERLSWVLWEEMRLPDVVIELTSESTRDDDHGMKKRVYEREWKTAVYVIYDPLTHALEGFQLEAGRYVPLRPNANGDLEIALLGLSLGLRELPLDSNIAAPSLRWIDTNGAPLPTYAETKARLATLETELARLRGG